MIRYVVWHPEDREGEFAFLTATQENWTESVTVAIDEARDSIKEMMLAYDPPLPRKIALEELGGKPKVYKLAIVEIPWK